MSRVKVSAEGQVTIPRDVRARAGLVEGQELMIEARGREVVLTPAGGRRVIDLDASFADLVGFFKYDGPPVSIAQMKEGVLAQAKKSYLKSIR